MSMKSATHRPAWCGGGLHQQEHRVHVENLAVHANWCDRAIWPIRPVWKYFIITFYQFLFGLPQLSVRRSENGTFRGQSGRFYWLVRPTPETNALLSLNEHHKTRLETCMHWPITLSDSVWVNKLEKGKGLNGDVLAEIAGVEKDSLAKLVEEIRCFYYYFYFANSSSFINNNLYTVHCISVLKIHALP